MRTVAAVLVAAFAVASAAAEDARALRGAEVIVDLPKPAGSAYSQEDALMWVHYAFGAYCTESCILAQSCPQSANYGVSQPAYQYGSSDDIASYTGVLPSGTPALVFRGTQEESLVNWWKNLDAIKTYPFANCPSCGVHKGFWESYQSIKPEIVADLADLGVSAGSTVAISGHSLGAAMAVLAAYDLTQDGYVIQQPAYTFGQPRVGDDAFYSAFLDVFGTDGWFRVVHYKDVVPHVPPELLDFHHTATEVWYNDESSSTFMVCNGSGEDDSCSDSLLLPDSISDHLDYLNVELTGFCGSEVAGSDD